jgi:lysine-N-methylase
LPQTRQVRPKYAEIFRCIGSTCEDTCCRGWNVVIDQEAYEKYRSLPESPLRVLLDASIQVTSEGAAASTGSGLPIFARMRMTESNQCPMLSAERLCRIQAECGEEFLPFTCATYPRIVHSVAGIEEMALALSCPEAARLVLLKPDLLGPLKDRLATVEESDAHEGSTWLPPSFWAIRNTMLTLVQNRAYPLWQRMFLLGLCCRRLDSIANGELNRSVADFLGDFDTTVASGSLRTPMEAIPADRTAQLDVVLRLAGMMLHRSNVRPRFVECIEAFTQGIGNSPSATLESLTARYAMAHDRFYAPFIGRHPYILENYLINTIFRCQFPFGREGMREGGSASVTREFVQLTAQFALMKGLLIGVAGFHRDGLSTEHVVHTVQAASKHFEHHPEFLNLAHELLVESRMDGARGLTILLRDTSSTLATSTYPAKSGSVQQDGISDLLRS